MKLIQRHRATTRLQSVVIAATTIVVLGARDAVAQSQPMPAPQHAIFIENDHRSGPRFGAAYLIGGSVTAEKAGQSLGHLTSLFGWQFERLFDAGPGLPTPVSELVLLAGGMEQGRLLPSASLLVGLRQLNGVEFGVGPTATGAGVQLAFAGGVTRKFGALNVPITLAVAPGRRGAAVSLTAGFNQ
jgi:hypothetical protein